jgi:hypothetical protein
VPLADPQLQAFAFATAPDEFVQTPESLQVLVVWLQILFSMQMVEAPHLHLLALLLPSVAQVAVTWLHLKLVGEFATTRVSQ